MTLTLIQQQRYARHIAMDAIGQHGQEILLSAKVAIVGMGGLGNPASMYLAAGGVGQLVIIDDDEVQLSNLQRQLLFKHSDIGLPKVVAAKRYLEELNPDSMVSAHQLRLDDVSAKQLFKLVDVVLDCTDNFQTRWAINKACHDLQKPLVWASTIGFSGQLGVATPYESDSHPCYGCFCGSMPNETDSPSCSDNGIIGSVAATMGAMQATEAIKQILSLPTNANKAIYRYDGLLGVSKYVALSKNPACEVCDATV